MYVRYRRHSGSEPNSKQFDNIFDNNSNDTFERSMLDLDTDRNSNSEHYKNI